MREIGKLTSWNDPRGFGFVTPLQSKQLLFVHISQFPQGRRPAGEEMLTYTPSTDAKGRPVALHVEFLAGLTEPIRFHWIPATWIALGISVVFLITLFVSSTTGKLPFAVPMVYALLSIILFQMYFADKQAAQQKRWRTPENRLHLLSLLGGWPGALVAQQCLRHKSQKTKFLICFGITMALNLIGLWFLYHFLTPL